MDESEVDGICFLLSRGGKGKRESSHAVSRKRSVEFHSEVSLPFPFCFPHPEAFSAPAVGAFLLVFSCLLPSAPGSFFRISEVGALARNLLRVSRVVILCGGRFSR